MLRKKKKKKNQNAFSSKDSPNKSSFYPTLKPILSVSTIVDHVRHIYVRGPNLDQPTPRWRLHASRVHTHAYTLSPLSPFVLVTSPNACHEMIARSFHRLARSPPTEPQLLSSSVSNVGRALSARIRSLQLYKRTGWTAGQSPLRRSLPSSNSFSNRGVRFREIESKVDRFSILFFFFRIFLWKKEKERKKEIYRGSQTIWKIIITCLRWIFTIFVLGEDNSDLE